MRKFLVCFSLVVSILVPQSAFAKKVKVQAITPFDSNNPPHSFTIKLNEPIFNDSLFLYKDTIINGYIYQTIPPKRLKQSASFIYIPTNYIDSLGKKQYITNVVTQYTTKFRPKDAITNALYIFGGVPVALATAGFYAAQGAMEDKNTTKTKDTLKASAENVYENSPLSLIEKGDFLKIQSNQDFLLNFIFIKNNAPNYDYQKVN